MNIFPNVSNFTADGWFKLSMVAPVALILSSLKSPLPVPAIVDIYFFVTLQIRLLFVSAMYKLPVESTEISLGKFKVKRLFSQPK